MVGRFTLDERKDVENRRKHVRVRVGTQAFLTSARGSHRRSSAHSDAEER